MRIQLPISLGFLISFAACTEQPTTIQVKLPTDAPKALQKHPVAPVMHHKGETLALRASAFDRNGIYMGPANVTWASNNPDVAEVSETGVVTIQKSGLAQITALGVGYGSELSSAMDFKVEIVGSVKIIPPSPTFSKIRIAKTAMLKAEVLDDAGKPLPEARVLWPKPDPHTIWVTPRQNQQVEIEGAAVGVTTLRAESDNVVAELEIETVE